MNEQSTNQNETISAELNSKRMIDRLEEQHRQIRQLQELGLSDKISKKASDYSKVSMLRRLREAVFRNKNGIEELFEYHLPETVPGVEGKVNKSTLKTQSPDLSDIDPSLSPNNFSQDYGEALFALRELIPGEFSSYLPDEDADGVIRTYGILDAIGDICDQAIENFDEKTIAQVKEEEPHVVPYMSSNPTV